MNRKTHIIFPILAMIFMVAALAGALLLAPTEKTMGDVQRIFYFHLGSAAAAFISFTCVLIASIGFIVRRETVWDNLATAAGEVGVLFTTFILVSGPLWARPVWGQWWVWDPRLTTTLILWFLYTGYLVLRQTIPGYRGAMAAAVFAILAYVDVPVVYFSVRWWRGIHPQVLRGGGGLDPRMIPPLLISVAAFLLLSGILIRERFNLANAADCVDSMAVALEDMES
jgi:heme exporter protein C